ncbi:MAG: hypothetical protein COA88_11760 [Kordia sp.]|nr:MAG: hypothetical protein COA88_11760 [Kordia sp.]
MYFSNNWQCSSRLSVGTILGVFLSLPEIVIGLGLIANCSLYPPTTSLFLGIDGILYFFPKSNALLNSYQAALTLATSARQLIVASSAVNSLTTSPALLNPYTLKRATSFLIRPLVSLYPPSGTSDTPGRSEAKKCSGEFPIRAIPIGGYIAT